MVCHQNNNKVAYRLIVHIFWNVFKHTYRPVIGLITFVLLWTGVTLACFKSSGNTSLSKQFLKYLAIKPVKYLYSF